MTREFFAFISYKSEDVEWAIWLQHELEHYRLPASFNGRTDIKHELRPVFRDIDELSAGNLPEQIQRALENSLNLIVICSPKAASSAWVNQEVETFIVQGKTHRIFPFIVDGHSPSDYFPKALLSLPKNEERLGGDVTKNGRDVAFIKVVSGMLGVDFDALWNRYEREKAEEERKQREQRDNLLRAQSRLIAEKADYIAKRDSHTALKLIQSILPQDLAEPNRPYTPEAEKVLRSILDQPNYVFSGHEEEVDDIAISPDDTRIASISQDNTLRLWDVLSGKQLWTQEAKCSYGKVAYSTDGKLIASSSWNGLINICNPEDGALLSSHHYEESLSYCFEFLSSHKLLIVDSENNVSILDVLSGDIESIKLDSHKHLNSAALSRDGLYLAISFCDNKNCNYTDIYVLRYRSSLLTNKEKFSLKRVSRISLEASAHSLSFDDESKKIAIDSKFENTVYLYDFLADTEKPLSKLLHNDVIECVGFSSKGDVLVASGHVLYSWDVFGHCDIKRVGHSDQINKILISKEKGYILTASCDGTFRVWWDSHNSELTNGTDSVDIKPDKKILTIHSRSLFDTDYSGSMPYFFSKDKSIRILKSDNCIILKNTNSGELISTIGENDNRILAADISFNNNLLATSLADNTIRIWDVQTQKCLCVLNGHESYINSVAFNHNNNVLISASEDETLRIWDLDSGAEIKRLSVFHKKEYKINHDKRFHSYYIGDGSELFAAQAAVFSLDDKYIIAGYGDGVLRIWNIDDGHCVQEIKAHDDEIQNVYLSDNGYRIITESSDKTTRIWEFKPLQELIDEVRDVFIDCPLDSEERRYYYLD